jgi:hypothetical protein
MSRFTASFALKAVDSPFPAPRSAAAVGRPPPAAICSLGRLPRLLTDGFPVSDPQAGSSAANDLSYFRDSPGLSFV